MILKYQPEHRAASTAEIPAASGTGQNRGKETVSKFAGAARCGFRTLGTPLPVPADLAAAPKNFPDGQNLTASFRHFHTETFAFGGPGGKEAGWQMDERAFDRLFRSCLLLDAAANRAPPSLSGRVIRAVAENVPGGKRTSRSRATSPAAGNRTSGRTAIDPAAHPSRR